MNKLINHIMACLLIFSLFNLVAYGKEGGSDNQPLKLSVFFGGKVVKLKKAIAYSKDLDVKELSKGYDYKVHKKGNKYKIWRHTADKVCLFSPKDTTIKIDISLPVGESGTLKVFLQEPGPNGTCIAALILTDKETIKVAKFGDAGKWIDCNFTKEDTAKGKLTLRVAYLGGGNVNIKAMKLYRASCLIHN